MKTLIEVAAAIKQRRQLLNISQEALAQVSGISLRSLKALEKGKANPTWNQLAKVLTTLGWEMSLRDIARSRPGPQIESGHQAVSIAP
jgi:transcriptional regulator with XRE-family HTH domain